MNTDERTAFRERRTLRILVYAMLLVSAASSLLMDDRLWQAAREGSLPPWMPLVPPVAFTAFVLVYGADRWLLVRRSRYPITRAFFQVAFALVFLTLLWPGQASMYREVRQHKAIAGPQRPEARRLLGHREAAVRAAACELVGLRDDLRAHEAVEDLAHNDKSPVVREACGEAAERLRRSARGASR